MSIKIYSVSGAPRAWRVLLGLVFKALDYDLVTLQISQGELKTPDFLKINPRATVPVLVDGEVVNTDSIGSLAWLDRAYPEKLQLFGSDAAHSAIIWQRVSDASDYLRKAADACLRPVFASKQGVPESGTEERKNWEQAAKNFKAELSLLEEYLESTEYIAGDQPTALDAVCYPELRILQRAIETRNETMIAVGLGSLKEFPQLVDWVDRVSNIKNVALTQPPHWEV